MDLLKNALLEYGVKEWPEGENPAILKYFNTMGAEWVKDDETAWCGAYMSYVHIISGKQASLKLNARSWLNIGEKVYSPELGDVVVFWRDRPDSWKGHVAFYINRINDWVYVLGGNQNNQVCIRPYLIDTVIGYRRTS